MKKKGNSKAMWMIMMMMWAARASKGGGLFYVDISICIIYLVIFVCHHSVLNSSKKFKVNVIKKGF